MFTKKNKFSFVVHPNSIRDVLSFNKFIACFNKRIPEYILKKWFRYFPCFSFMRVVVESEFSGKKAEGVAIMCPLLPSQLVSFNSNFVLKKILTAIRVSERWGASIIGLGGFTSIVTEQGKKIIPFLRKSTVTSGNTYTAAMVIYSIRRIMELINRDLTTQKILLVGATGNIGRSCSRFFSKKSKKLFLVARDCNKLEDLKKDLNDERVEIVPLDALNDFIGSADIIILATSSFSSFFDGMKVKQGGIVCDVSLPANIARDIVSYRNDILVFEGGFSRVPNYIKMGDDFKKIFPHQSIFGCLAETIILALEERFESYSLGTDEISLDRVDEIYKLGLKHGFGVGSFFCGNKTYSIEEIRAILKNDG